MRHTTLRTAAVVLAASLLLSGVPPAISSSQSALSIPPQILLLDPPLSAGPVPPLQEPLASPLEFPGETSIARRSLRELPLEGCLPLAAALAEQLKREERAFQARAGVETAEQGFLTPEIVALAQGLENDPLLIYQHVHEHIDILLTHGLMQSPRETSLSGVGSPLDQAALLVSLMRAAGYAARYATGIVALSFSQAMAWTGAQTTDVAVEAFRQGGFNVTRGNNYVAIIHVWAEVQIDGAWVGLDPGFKRVELTAPVNLSSAMGYQRASFLSTALSGATVTAGYVQNLNADGIRTRLAGYAHALVEHLDQSSAFAGADEVVGARRIVPSQDVSLPDELPYTVVGDMTTFSEVSTLFQYGIRIQVPGMSDVIRTTASISGERLTIFFEPARPADAQRIADAGGIYQVYPAYEVHMVPVVAVSGVQVVRGAPLELGAEMAVTFTLQAPWRTSSGQLYFQPSAVDLMWVGASAALVGRMPGVSPAQISRHQAAVMDAALAESVGDEAVFGEALTLLGLSYFHEQSLARQLGEAVTGVLATEVAAFGWVSQNVSVELESFGGEWRASRVSLGAPGLDAFMDFYSLISTTGDGSAEDACDFVESGLGSALEHAIFEQLQDLPSISTVQVLRQANRARQRIYRLTSGNVEAIVPLLELSDGDQAYFRDLVQDGYEVIVPEDDIQLNDWLGRGWIEREPGGLSEAFIISGGLAGGGGTQPRTVTLDGLQPDIWRVPLAGPSDDPNMTETTNPRHVADPIDPATGAFVHSELDLCFGDLGFPIAFQRSYSSARHRVAGSLGPGWTHTYEMKLSVGSDWARTLGRGTAVDAAEAIVFAWVAADIADMRADTLPWERILIGCEMAHWLAGQLTENALLVADHRGTAHSYLACADGSYRAGGPTYSRLVVQGSGYVLQGKDGSRIDFDAQGRLSALTDVDGNRTSLTYDGVGHLVRVQDAAGRGVTLAYQGDLLAQLGGLLGQVSHYAYSAAGQLTSVTDVGGHVTQYAYDAGDRLVSITDPLGQTYVSSTYDSWGRVTAQSNGLGGQTTVVYGGRRVRVTDPTGSQCVYTYDARNRLVALENDLGARRTMSYDGNGNPVAVTDGLGRTTSFVFDGRGNVVSVTSASGQTTTYAYGAGNDLIGVTDPLGDAWRYEYDGKHHLTRAVNPLGNASRYAYNARGLLTGAIDESGHQTTLSYDDAGNLVEVRSPLGASTRLSYDVLGRLTTVTDPNGGITRYGYDSLGNLVSVEDAEGGEVRAVYDGNRSLVQLVDALGHATAYSYDAQLGLLSVTDPLGRVERFQYDLAGRVVSRIRAGGSNVVYRYDGAGQLIEIDYGASDRAEFRYDAAGQLVQATRGSWEEQRSYNQAGLLRGVDYPGLGLAISPAYDEAGRRVRLAVSARGAPLTEWNYEYDDAARATRVWQASAARNTQLQYDARGNLTTVIHPSGAKSLFTFDADGRVSGAEARDGTGSSIAQWTYSYDPAGNLTRSVETRSGMSRSVSYSYDRNGRLTAEDHARYSVGYRYDAAGNRTEITDARGTTVYTYDAADQLLSAGGRTFAYDQSGNCTGETQGGRTVAFGWDPADRLREIELPDGSVCTSTYDAFGRLVARSGAVESVQVVYDGWSPLLRSADGFASGDAYTSVMGRLTGREPFGAGGSPSASLHSDGLGNIRLLSDQFGLPRDVFPAGTFGYPGRQAGVDEEPYRFAGEWGVETVLEVPGLYWAGVRVYDSSSGRFLSRDPLAGGMGAADNLNPYAYSLNNPLRYLDPSGLRPVGQIRVERSVERLTQAIVAWAVKPGRQGFDPVEFALRLTFYQQAALQRIRELQQWLAQLGQRDVPTREGAPGYAQPQDLARLRLTESIEVLEGVLRRIGDLLEGQTWR